MSNDNNQEIIEESEIKEEPNVEEPVSLVETQSNSSGLRELEEYGSPEASQAIPIEEVEEIEEPQPQVTVETIPVVSSVADKKLVEPVQETSTLVPVKGNTKVYRCLKCKTFVSASKPHTEADCLARKHKESKKDIKTKSRKRKVDKELLKSLKVLEKRNSSIEAKNSVISKKAQALIKKFGKKAKKSSPTIPKQMISFLDLVSKKLK